MTMMPPVAPIDPPDAQPTQPASGTLVRGAPPLLLPRTEARNRRVLQRMIAGGLLDRGVVALRSRELMILRTCARRGAEYEWGVHVATFGSRAHWTPTQLHSTVYGGSEDDCWGAEDRLVLRLADQLYDARAADDTLWQALIAQFAPGQLVELILLAGLFHAASYTVNAVSVQSEACVPAFPKRHPAPVQNR